jgi:hypothetical protein
MAILLALITNNNNNQVTIHTDSMAAIWALRGHASTYNTRTKNKPNRALLQATRELIHDGGRMVHFVHVRAHTANTDEASRLNRRAEIEANRARMSGVLQPPDLSHYGDVYTLTWRGATIDARVYSEVYAGITRSRLTNPSNTGSTGAMFVRTDVWVDASDDTLRNGKPTERAFRWRCLTRTLPTRGLCWLRGEPGRPSRTP